MDKKQLNHSGIKGMRWGIRRFQNKDGSLTPEGRKRYADNDGDEGASDDYKRAHSKKSVKSMSDAELRNRLNRINMEKQYIEATKKQKSAGAKFVSDVLYNTGKNVATNYATKYATKGVDAFIERMTKKLAKKAVK